MAAVARQMRRVGTRRAVVEAMRIWQGAPQGPHAFGRHRSASEVAGNSKLSDPASVFPVAYVWAGSRLRL
jgi:hypothetical protein